MEQLVAVTDRGYRIGDDHQNAKLTDAECETIRDLHDQGMTYPQLAEKFEVSKWAIGKICRYERRGQIAARYKRVTVHVTPDESGKLPR